VSRPRPPVTTDLACDHAEQGASVTRRKQSNLVGLESLVGGRDHLVFGGQVHPELDTVEQAAGDDKLLGGVSMWRMPPPAVIHCVAPLVMRPPPPLESWWAKVPSIM